MKTYKSINFLHQKHKSYAFDWNHRELNTSIEQNNGKISKKIQKIRSYLQSKSTYQNLQNEPKSK